MKQEKSMALKGLHLGLEIVKVGLKVAAVAAAFCAVRELHQLHKSMENHHHHNLLHRK